MNIGIIRQRYVRSGGAERYLNVVAQEMASRGHTLHLFAHAWAAEDSDRIRFHRVPRIPMTSALRALSFAVFCDKMVRREACDVVFSLERTLRQDVYRAGDGCHREWLAQRARFVSPLKRAAITLNPLHRALLALEKRTFSPDRTGWVIANSKRGKEEIIRHYRFPAERILVVHNAVDLRRFSPAARDSEHGGRRLVFAGTGFERKGLRFCIEALSRLPACYSLSVVGKGSVKVFQALAARLGVDQRVRFLGYDLDLTVVYAASDLLVHPAVYEPFANVCLEAMACGLPVVTSAINGASEIIEHGGNGAIVANPSDIAELAAAIRLFEDRAKWEDASRAARRTAERQPFNEHIERTLAILEMAGKARQR